MPSVVKIYPKLKLVLTGGGYEGKANFLINLGLVKKRNLFNLIYNSKAMLVPLDRGTGTRIKIIEALSLGSIVLSTPKGAEGIKLKKLKNNNLFIAIKNKFIGKKKKILKKKNNYINLKYFHEEYMMENIVLKFFKEKNVKNIFKKN